MGIEQNLLRLLEPAVRPVGPVGGMPTPAGQPFENRSFDDLLNEARHQEVALPTVDGEADPLEESPKPSPLRPLAGVSAIENASLRQVIGRAAGGEV